jgi:hypothetical protein
MVSEQVINYGAAGLGGALLPLLIGLIRTWLASRPMPGPAPSPTPGPTPTPNPGPFPGPFPGPSPVNRPVLDWLRAILDQARIQPFAQYNGERYYGSEQNHSLSRAEALAAAVYLEETAKAIRPSQS